MTDEKKISNNENSFLADLDAYRTGEELDVSRISEKDRQAIEDLNRISKLFSDAKPYASEIPESVDNAVLGHIKQKSREIRRDRKVVRLFPRYKWAAAAVMGVLVCVVSFNLIYKTEKPADTSFKDNSTQILTESFRNAEEENKFTIQNQELAKPIQVRVDSIQGKHGHKTVISEMPVVITPDDESKNIPAGSAKDIDGNGRVNIIDAYIMDRRLMSGIPMQKNMDLNGDGYINKEDIKSIVKTAVSLEGGKV